MYIYVIYLRLWNVLNATCLKLFQHHESPVLSMAWILTFNGVVTLDGNSTLRTFRLNRQLVMY